MSNADPRIPFFNHHAASWDSYGPSGEETLRRLDELRPLFGLRAGLDLLEIGCGTGQLTGWLVEQVRPGRVTSIDFASEMLERARARGVVAKFRRLDICTDDVGLAEHDVAWCKDAFPHFRNQHAALENTARALRPGGQLIVLHLDSRQNINAFHDEVGGPVAGDHLPGPARWRQMLTAAGLRLTKLIERHDLFCLMAERTDNVAAT